MIYPIVAYGDPVLKKLSKNIEKDSIDVQKLAQDMFETMYNARGVGLAAPQIGLPYRMFVADSAPANGDEKDDEDEEEDNSINNIPFKKVFVNPQLISETGENWGYEEGCLSIPGIRSEIFRLEKVLIKYFDENWVEHQEEFQGFPARIIQHEYDHIQGVLFIDYMSPIRKRLVKAKLSNISKGIVDVNYKMKFPVKR